MGVSIPRRYLSRQASLAVLEFTLLVGIYLADWQHFVIPSKVPYLFAIAWTSLYLRQLRWRDVGFRLYRDWPTTLAIGVAAGIAMELLELFCTQPLLVRITGQMPDLSAFSRVAGNVRWLATSLALTWTLFAFGEELVFRGYLMDRIAGLLGRTARGWAVALLTASLVFGLSHFQQGITGVSENVVDGLILGAIYLKLGGNLAVPIVAHGVTDTVDLVLLFLHRYPGLH
ncbi:MAG: type II CAAX endopeptidase family protein [Steroidobacteraceae bacterium]